MAQPLANQEKTLPILEHDAGMKVSQVVDPGFP